MFIKNLQLTALVLLSIYSYPAYAEVRTVTATGRGEVIIPQTIANIQLAVNEDGKTAQEAQNKVRTKSAAVIKVLREEKTFSMETASINVNPIMSYTDNKPKLIGYSANYTIQIKASIANAGNIIDHAITAGAAIIDEPKLSASDADVTKAEKEAIRLATIDAKTRAETSLNALGLRPLTVTQITVQNINNHPQPIGPALMRASDSSTPPTQVIGGNTSVIAEVSLNITF